MNKKLWCLGWGWDCNRGAVYAITNEPTWIAVGVAVGAALSWRKPKNKKSKD